MKAAAKQTWKRALSLSLACIVLMLLLVPLTRTEAEAASSYKVHHWSLIYGYSGGEEYYSVYTDPNEKDQATFSSSTCDVYTNLYSGQDVRITFFRDCYGTATAKKADTFVKYLEEHSGYKHCHASWYSFDEKERTFYYVYCIEGFNFDKSNLKISKLTDRSPFVNCGSIYSPSTTYLDILYLGEGNMIREDWDSIYNDYNCSAAAVIERSGSKESFTLGFAFRDEANECMRRYTPYEYE